MVKEFDIRYIFWVMEGITLTLFIRLESLILRGLENKIKILKN